MAGKRLLDAALLFNATRTIARQHLRLRSEQFEVWSKTSSLAKVAKSRSNRVNVAATPPTVTSRQYEHSSQPAVVNDLHAEQASDTNALSPQETVAGVGAEASGQLGLNQDLHYDRSEQNQSSNPAPDGDLEIQQKKPSHQPIVDGSIPFRDGPADSAPINSDTDSQRVEPQKGVLAQEQTGQTGELNPDTSQKSTTPKPEKMSNAALSKEEAVSQEYIPEGINTDIFSSPRVARMLGSAKTHEKAGEERQLEKAKRSLLDDVKFSKSKHQDFYEVHNPVSSTTNEREMSSTKNSTLSHMRSPETDIHSLATDIAKEVDTDSLTGPEVGSCSIPCYSHDSQADQLTAKAQTSTATDFQRDRPTPEMRESRVPASAIGRLWQYGSLATGMAFGAVGESFRRATGTTTDSGPLILSARNMERLVARLSRMRGAALKLGQMMSFQDSKMLPAPIAEVLRRVQDHADYMPTSQRNGVLASNLGTEWRSLFSSFSDVPLAAASIGQVHHAVLASTNKPVAVKIQYPGVANSISSDLNNISLLLTASRLLPKGLYLDKTIANARTELAWECDYKREAECQTRFRELLADETDVFTVPAVVTEVSGPQVLTAELMSGIGVTKAALNLTQEQRDWIGTHILRLCLRELMEFKFMQTDPNWTNFLYNAASNKLELLDFGAAREYPDRFVDPYVRTLIAAAKGDRETVTELSVQLGYLTGHESRTMLDAHIASVLTLSEPFAETASPDVVYDFKDQTITDRVRGLIPVMIRERLAPPPEETYSLHRKLSGAFLLLARLGSRVKCREMFLKAVAEWEQRHEGQKT